MINFTANFNSKLSRAALDKFYTHHPKWNEKQANSDYPCGQSYCYMEWCEILSGNYKQDKDSISQKTNNLMGLSDVDYKEFTHERNSLARLEAFYLFHTTGIFGVDGFDTEDFGRDGFGRDGFNIYGFKSLTSTYVFNADLSRAALDMIRAHPEQWNHFDYHRDNTHSYIGWCDVLLGNWNGLYGLVKRETKEAIGLNQTDFCEFISWRNTLARLEALHLFHTTGTFGVNGYDTNGFNRQGFDVNGNLPYVFVDRYRFDEYGFDRQGYDAKGIKYRLIDKYKSN